MTQGVKGIVTLIAKGIKSWRADVHGVPEAEMRERGVLDPNVLPNYPYRDDVLPLHAIIKKYVTTVLEHHYGWYRQSLYRNAMIYVNVHVSNKGAVKEELIIDLYFCFENIQAAYFILGY